MNLHGTVIDGVIVLDQQQALPEGARVEVILKMPVEAHSPLGELLLRHAGTAVDLPDDMAAQHDHYLHRTPKR